MTTQGFLRNEKRTCDHQGCGPEGHATRWLPCSQRRSGQSCERPTTKIQITLTLDGKTVTHTEEFQPEDRRPVIDDVLHFQTSNLLDELIGDWARGRKGMAVNHCQAQVMDSGGYEEALAAVNGDDSNFHDCGEPASIKHRDCWFCEHHYELFFTMEEQ